MKQKKYKKTGKPGKPSRRDRREERRQANQKAYLSFRHPYHVDDEGNPRRVAGCPKCIGGE